MASPDTSAGPSLAGLQELCALLAAFYMLFPYVVSSAHLLAKGVVFVSPPHMETSWAGGPDTALDNVPIYTPQGYTWLCTYNTDPDHPSCWAEAPIVESGWTPMRRCLHPGWGCGYRGRRGSSHTQVHRPICHIRHMVGGEPRCRFCIGTPEPQVAPLSPALGSILILVVLKPLILEEFLGVLVGTVHFFLILHGGIQWVQRVRSDHVTD